MPRCSGGYWPTVEITIVTTAVCRATFLAVKFIEGHLELSHFIPLRNAQRWSVNMPNSARIKFLYLLLSVWLCLEGRSRAESENQGELIRVPIASTVNTHQDSFWGQRSQMSQMGIEKSMTPLMLGSEKSHFVRNFRIAAGLDEGTHRGPAWNDGDCYKSIETLSAYYAQSSAPQLRKLLDEVIVLIAAARRSDGYLHTPVLIASRNKQGEAQTLGDPANFEMYNMGHLMTAAAVHFEATGDRRLFLRSPSKAQVSRSRICQARCHARRHAICPAHYMGTLDLYRTTEDERYLQLCQRWMSMRELVQGGDDNQDRIPFPSAARSSWTCCSSQFAFLRGCRKSISSDADDVGLLETLTACWDSVQRRKIYVTGGCGRSV